MAILSLYLSIITLNTNKLNSPIERHWTAEWIFKKNPILCCLKETHFNFTDTLTLQMHLVWE